MGRVSGKVAFITGAARGQGRSHAVRLAEEGADIIAVDLCGDVPEMPYPGGSLADLEETVRLVEATGRRIVARKADVRSLDELRAAVDEGVAELGRLDVVVANAGVLTAIGPFDTMSEAAFADLVDINLTGVWRTVTVAMPHLRASGPGGSIILTSSSAGIRASRNTAHYVASKFGVVGLMRAMALELGPEMIRVNSVHPTQVDTPMIQNEFMYRRARPDLAEPGRDDLAEASLSRMAMPIPWVDPVEIAHAVVFLASEESRYVTGLAMTVDGGISIA
ncbi:mycofactocin-coupled SDR family oxidoreductase [Nocardioides panacihumi]|uniref:Mycofactocin-coupled SDR family oxidoreductase n=1 Tax=Nocardioides panacihumi TaxID=400774 RepID=A0ABN2QAE5_9ACTN